MLSFWMQYLIYFVIFPSKLLAIFQFFKFVHFAEIFLSGVIFYGSFGYHFNWYRYWIVYF